MAVFFFSHFEFSPSQHDNDWPGHGTRLFPEYVPGFRNRVETSYIRIFPPNSSAPLLCGQKLRASSSEIERRHLHNYPIRIGPGTHQRGLKDTELRTTLFTDKPPADGISNTADSDLLLMLKRPSNVIAIMNIQSQIVIRRRDSERGKEKPSNCLSSVARRPIFAQM